MMLLSKIRNFFIELRQQPDAKNTDPPLTVQAGTQTLLGTYAVDFASKKR